MNHSKFKITDKQDRKEFIDSFWLNLKDINNLKTANVIGQHPLFNDNPPLAIVDLMSKPENFGYTCSILFDFHLHPLQVAVLKLLWNHPFSVFTATRGGSKTTLLAVYAMLRAIFVPNSKVLFIGNAFRQSKLIFSHCENIYHRSPMLKDILSNNSANRISHNVDMFQFSIEDSTITSIPLGNGDKIRGQRSTCTIADEFNNLNEEIYQEVIQGFSSVSLNPIEQVRERAKYKAMVELGEISQEKFLEIQASKISNQQIISGTCGYIFEPMYKMWKRYHDIIYSRNDKHKLQQLFGNELPIGYDRKDYAIIRLPYDVFPEGYIDEKSIGRAKATTHSGIFGSEYQTLFLKDSQGFFKRTLIEGAVCGNPLAQIIKKCGEIEFTIMMEGNRTGKYVMGVDPASETDNFALVILEIWEDHRRIVHSWTTNNYLHKMRLKTGLVKEHDYYRSCVRKIRDLMKLFNIEEIAIDAQGGGGSIREILGDPNYLEPGEHPLYPIKDDSNPRETDHLGGRHILHMIEFASAEWTYNANHNLKQDIETRELLFPACSSADFGLLHDMDVLTSRVVEKENQEIADLRETAEDVLLEIEELKNELVLIEHTKTPSGRDKWDTPQVKGLNAKKGRLRKDRYSALLMANSIGRSMIARTIEFEYNIIGGFAKNLAGKVHPSKIPDVSAGYSYGIGVRRR